MKSQERKIVILFSGNGSNMLNLIEKLHQREFLDSQNKLCQIIVAACICNNPQARGLQHLESKNIPHFIIPSKNRSKQDFEYELVEKIRMFDPALCVLSGFMRILSPYFTTRIKALNIHPSFLPLHKGAYAIKESFQSEENYGGVSVHWVNEELDSGEIILQEKLEKITNESFESFETRIHALEYDLFPQAILLALNLKRVKV